MPCFDFEGFLWEHGAGASTGVSVTPLLDTDEQTKSSLLGNMCPEEFESVDKAAKTVEDIKNSIHGIGRDIAIAVCAMLPGIGFFFCLWVCIKYFFLKRHIYAPKGPWFVPGWAMDMYNTFVLLSNCYSSLKLSLARDKAHEVVWVSAMETGAVTSILSIAALAMRRILNVACAEVSLNVDVHKHFEEGLLETSPQAFKLLKSLQDKFGEIFETAQDVDKHDPTARVRVKISQSWSFINGVSALAIFFGVAWMSLWQNHLLTVGESKALHQQISLKQIQLVFYTGISNESRYQLVAGLFIAFTCGVQWFRLTNKIVVHNDNMNRNISQLLIFRAITATSADATGGTWSRSEKKKLIEFAGTRSFQGACPMPKKIEKQFLHGTAIVKQLRQKVGGIDLKTKDGVKTWMALREYILIDFLNETCSAEFASAIVVTLVVTIFVVMFMEYAVYNAVSLLIMMLSISSVSLGLLLYSAIDKAIDLNRMLEADCCMLMTEAVRYSLSNENIPTVEMLKTLHQFLKEYDDKVMLFGIKVTPKLRNGLAMSIGLAALDLVRVEFQLILATLHNLVVGPVRD